MTEPIKFTEEELKQITTIQATYGQLASKIGQLYLERYSAERRLMELDKEIDSTRDEYETVRTQERDFATQLIAKYGNGELNPQTGVFTPRPAVTP